MGLADRVVVVVDYLWVAAVAWRAIRTSNWHPGRFFRAEGGYDMKRPAKSGFASIEEYLSSQDEEARKRLDAICRIIRKAAPRAEGRISYDMPAFFCNGRLVYFCAFKKHIGFYPASMTVFDEFRDELRGYKQSGRGTIQFPYDSDLPLGLIKKIVEFRIKENERKKTAVE
jgi:uncharacterized protein YdhG (YjbR/CyaY superfamily)